VPLDRHCKVDGCARPVIALGMCESHYRRNKTHGSPTGGSTGAGEAARFLREVVLRYDRDECLPWPFARDDSGYGKIKDGNQIRKVSRIVCEKTHGPPPTPDHEAAHSCGKGHEGCAAPRHLSWKTPAENQADRITHGTDGRGERNPMAKLTASQIADIRARAGTMSQRAMGEMYGVAQTTISAIQRNVNWKTDERRVSTP